METKEHRKNIQGLCDNSQRNNIDKMVISEREYQKKSKFFPKLMLDTKLQTWEAQRTVKRINAKTTVRHIFEDEENILNPNKYKNNYMIQPSVI